MSRTDDDFRHEIEAHLALETERLIGEGHSPDEARSMARRRFGNVTGARERFHESQHVMWLEDLRKDVGYALRSLRRTPGFAAVAILTLALGIGANTAIFSVINGVLLRPLPYPGADRLVTIIENRPASEPFDGRPARRSPFGEDIRALGRETRTLSDVHIYGPAPALRLPGREEEPGLPDARASGPLLTMLGARPAMGRLFAPDESEPVVVLSYEAWQRDFGGDPAILGRTVIVENGNVASRRTREPHTIVGITEPGFYFPDPDVGYWMPRGGAYNLARIKEGVSPAVAADEVSAVLHRIVNKAVVTGGAGPPRFELVTLHDRLVAPVRPALSMLAFAVGLILLIACVNVANLLLSRAGLRQMEVALRTALGANRGRLVRQMLTESMTLAGLGGAAGVALAYGGLHVLRGMLIGLAQPAGQIVRQIGVELGVETGFPRLHEIELDTPALLFTVTLSLATGIVFGLAPALQQVGRDRLSRLRAGAHAFEGGLRLTRRNAPRALLVVAEIAMAMVLLIGGGLMIHGFVKLVNADSGYESSNVLTFQVRRPASRSTTTELVSMSELLLRDLSSTPGVGAAAYAAHLPLLMLKVNMGFRTSATERLPEPADGPAPATPFFPDIRVVSHGYFATLGIPLTAGRGFRESDGVDAPPVVVVNSAFASARFPGQNPIGRLLFGPGERPWEIVGLAGDVRQQGADRAPEPQIFIEYRQWPLPGMQNPLYYVVRTDGDPRRMLPAVRSLVTRHDNEATLENIATLDELVASAMARTRLYAVLLGIFAAVAAVLAAVGIYGVVAFSVSQSTREIGIRLALGAERREVLALVLKHGLALAAAGSAIGLAGAAAGTRLLQGMLFGVAPLDAPTYVAVLVLFAGVALLASYVPARRAMRVDPLVALRHD